MLGSPEPPRFQGTKLKSWGLEKGHGLVPRIPFLNEMAQAGGEAEDAAEGCVIQKRAFFWGEGGGIAEEGGQQNGGDGLGTAQHPS